MMKGSTKVGSRATSACFNMDAGKRCGTIAEAVEASRSPTAGFRAFLPKYQAMVAILSTREASKAVFDEIAPLTAAAELAKTIIRGRRGLVVTQAIQDDLRELIVWHAKRCGAELRAVGGIHQPMEDNAPNPKNQQGVTRMLTKERRLIGKMQAGITVPRSSSSSTVGSTISTGSPSTTSSDSFESVLSRRYFILCSSSNETRGVVRSPCTARLSSGVAYVAARRPLVVLNSCLDARLLWG